jgi:hypothetical protein
LLEGKKEIRNTIVLETVKNIEMQRKVPGEEYTVTSGRT